MVGIVLVVVIEIPTIIPPVVVIVVIVFKRCATSMLVKQCCLRRQILGAPQFTANEECSAAGSAQTGEYKERPKSDSDQKRLQPIKEPVQTASSS
mmetsp:Transcript_53551/g.138429  ORF Transcript_53551/g.138429 Transcript_53551/m.138429 type:complete len:95 (-) Transcript_53551:746-1030(-)